MKTQHWLLLFAITLVGGLFWAKKTLPKSPRNTIEKNIDLTKPYV